MKQRLSEKELTARLNEATQQVIVGAEYTHYKNQLYKVLGLAILEATNEIGVIYQAQYGKNLTFIRPLTDWVKDVEWQGGIIPRFAKYHIK